ncbi:PH domain-containing protein [Corynebacterium liangguodongii]|uniref:Uncharacterized protein n=1 Tax=Corynebacterium liangguodongii TaxID=2079535 RepID=A0A2S0WDL8_9CORY|nr:PH domain-containing protein [Corynebacterium liangguodongii]AWB83868.1 hypothetical protein C3E79_04725 [Corynebacterium liangguodongii]PWB99007.1 PH domain-containing protein [Corynebacterium liangguodongii]
MTDSPQVFRPTREHILAIVLMTAIALIGIAWAPLVLGWILLFPAAYLAWVLSSSTTVSSRGIETRYLMRRNASLAWGELAGIAFQGARALATTKDGSTYPLPGVTFNTIPELSEASGGAITDVITQSAEAADGKYEIIDRAGHKVLLTRDEYDAYVRVHPDLYGPRPAGSTKI